jgi:hypothetical protein
LLDLCLTLHVEYAVALELDAIAHRAARHGLDDPA